MKWRSEKEIGEISCWRQQGDVSWKGWGEWNFEGMNVARIWLLTHLRLTKSSRLDGNATELSTAIKAFGVCWSFELELLTFGQTSDVVKAQVIAQASGQKSSPERIVKASQQLFSPTKNFHLKRMMKTFTQLLRVEWLVAGQQAIKTFSKAFRSLQLATWMARKLQLSPRQSLLSRKLWLRFEEKLSSNDWVVCTRANFESLSKAFQLLSVSKLFLPLTTVWKHFVSRLHHSCALAPLQGEELRQISGEFFIVFDVMQKSFAFYQYTDALGVRKRYFSHPKWGA